MLTHLRPAIVLLGLMTVLTGVIYPLSLTGLLQIAVPRTANGSLVERDGKVVGSQLIGQVFASERYFHGRPSAAGQNGYDAAASSGSNLGPLSRKLVDRVTSDVAGLKSQGIAIIPADAVTTSASGLDPDISPAHAAIQIERVARARGIAGERVRAIVSQVTALPDLGVFGEPRVNVLQLNLALDAALAPGAG